MRFNTTYPCRTWTSFYFTEMKKMSFGQYIHGFYDNTISSPLAKRDIQINCLIYYKNKLNIVIKKINFYEVAREILTTMPRPVDRLVGKVWRKCPDFQPDLDLFFFRKIQSLRLQVWAWRWIFSKINQGLAGSLDIFATLFRQVCPQVWA